MPQKWKFSPKLRIDYFSSSFPLHNDLMVLCTFMEFSLGISIFERMKLLQTYSETNSLLQSHSCRSGQPCSLFLISTTQDHSSYVYGQHPIVEGEYLHKSRPSVQWKLQIWGRKCRVKHLFLYQFAGCLIWPHFRKIECSCLSEVDIACVTLIMGGVNYIYCYPIWRFQNDGNRVDWVRDIFSSWGNTIPLVKLPSLVSLHCILSGQQRLKQISIMQTGQDIRNWQARTSGSTDAKCMQCV